MTQGVTVTQLEMSVMATHSHSSVFQEAVLWLSLSLHQEKGPSLLTICQWFPLWSITAPSFVLRRCEC